ncbi:antibiotic biosynthesis monooxygenase family protein [Arhodomonas sp. AD133]|uniref:antibiotic biosynthesis monooxygenase family protein n=1 Tax=Arhodomonas sp. AD133 TaxID=3415009 RepID=UPI003EB7B135
MSATRNVTVIDPVQPVLTLINVFDVSPSRQQELVDLLVHATETVMKYRPGFIAANIHRSEDGTRVVNYAQWRSRDDFEAMLQDPSAIPHMRAVGEMANAEPMLFEIVHVRSCAPSGSPDASLSPPVQ